MPTSILKPTLSVACCQCISVTDHPSTPQEDFHHLIPHFTGSCALL
jgi:hypothetical protein